MTDKNAMNEAAASLQSHLFGPPSLHSEGFIGVGTDKLHVYVHAAKKRWRHDTPGEWSGLPVIWHFGIGRARAYGEG